MRVFTRTGYNIVSGEGKDIIILRSRDDIDYAGRHTVLEDFIVYDSKTDPLKQLQTELATAKKQILDYEQTEASVLPEDVGIKEYVPKLQAGLATANDENKRLRDAIQKMQNAKIANMKPGSVALYQMFIKETAEQALNPTKDKENDHEV